MSASLLAESPDDDKGGYGKSFSGYQNVGGTGDQNGSAKPTGPKSDKVINLFCAEVNQDLMISKIFYFFFYAAFGSLFPLISIYFKQLGMNPVQAGLLVGIRPFVEFASAPMWGAFADRFRKGRILLLFSLSCWIIFTLALNFVHPDTPYCLVDNGTYAFLQKSHADRAFNLPDNDDTRELDLANGRTPMNREDLFVERGRTKGISPINLDRDKVAGYPKDADLVKPPFSTKVYQRSKVEEVFLLLLLIIIIGEFFSAPAITLADSCTLNYLGDHPEFYGKQRMFGSLGWGLSMFIIGIALDHSLVFGSHPCGQTDLHEKNYTTCFAAFSVLMGCALITSVLFRFETGASERPDTVTHKIMDIHTANVDPAVAENARARGPEAAEASRGPKWFSVLKTFASPHYASFLFVAWFFGFGVGLVFCFLFWHLQDIGGSPTLYGIASVINHLSEIFAYFFSFRLINAVGHIKVLYIGLLANVCRFLYISWLTDPWWVLPFEFVQGITHAAVWAAATSYISLAAPAQYKSSAQGVLQGLHHGLGRACGALIGGIIITYTGTQVMFRIYGFSCLVILIVFFAVNRLLKIEGIKYQANDFDDDPAHALAPHGIPMTIPYSQSEEKLTGTAAAAPGYGYGATDPTQDAYDRYVHEPYDKPVRFDQLPSNLSKR